MSKRWERNEDRLISRIDASRDNTTPRGASTTSALSKVATVVTFNALFKAPRT